MSKQTNIQYAHSSCNLQMGCSGCELWNKERKSCYAGKQTAKWGGRKGWPRVFEEPTLFIERLDECLKWGPPTDAENAAKPWIPKSMPRIVFLNDMGDTFDAKLPLNWLAPLLPLLAKSAHQFLILTKRPSRFAEFAKRFPLPSNVWPGTTITSAATAKRADFIREIDSGGPHYLSVEPIWGEIPFDVYQGFQWVQFGGESADLKEGEPCNETRLEWITRGIDWAHHAGAKVFVKQLGTLPYIDRVKLTLKDNHGGNWDEWPEQFRVREYPYVPTSTQASLL